MNEDAEAWIVSKREYSNIENSHDNLLRAAMQWAYADAAKACLVRVPREAGHNGQWEGYGTTTGPMTGPECAAAIEARSK